MPDAREELNISVREGRIESRHSTKSLEGIGWRSHDLGAELRMHSFTVNCETFLNDEWWPLLNRPAHSKATLGDRSFSFASSSVWNSIPNDVRCAPSLSSFKSRLKTYLFHSVCKDWTFSLITVHMCMAWPCHSFIDDLS